MMEDIKPFVQVFNKIAHAKSDAQVFTDFLDICICALSAGAYEEEYFSIIKKYKKEEVNLFCELFAQMVMIMDDNGQGLKDCLGQFYQLNLSNRRNGEFFTPPHIAQFMAQVTMDENTVGKKIIDPCCGAGIMLLSAAKVSRRNYFFGADISSTSCKVCTINMALNSLEGEVAWMNSLSGEHWGGYSITRLCGRIPIIRKVSPNEGIIINSVPFNRKGIKEEEMEAEERQVPTDKNTIVIQTKLDL